MEHIIEDQEICSKCDDFLVVYNDFTIYLHNKGIKKVFKKVVD